MEFEIFFPFHHTRPISIRSNCVCTCTNFPFFGKFTVKKNISLSNMHASPFHIHINFHVCHTNSGCWQIILSLFFSLLAHSERKEKLLLKAFIPILIILIDYSCPCQLKCSRAAFIRSHKQSSSLTNEP